MQRSQAAARHRLTLPQEGAAGLHPAPASSRSNGRSNGNSRLWVFCGLGGAVWGCRTRRIPSMRRDGAIHGANGPAAPYRPALDSFPMTVVDPRHAWMNFQRNRIFRQLNEEHPRMAWIYRVDQGRHPPGAGHAIPTDRGKLSKAGWVRLRGRERHGWRDRAYMDVFTAPPATGPTPPSHGMPAVAVAVAVAIAVDSAGAGRSPAEPPT